MFSKLRKPVLISVLLKFTRCYVPCMAQVGGVGRSPLLLKLLFFPPSPLFLPVGTGKQVLCFTGYRKYGSTYIYIYVYISWPWAGHV